MGIILYFPRIININLTNIMILNYQLKNYILLLEKNSRRVQNYMKKICVNAILVLIAASPLFRGLFFSVETYGFLAVISILMFLYFFSKIISNEEIHVNILYYIPCVLLITAGIISFAGAVNKRENLDTVMLYAACFIAFLVLSDYFYENPQKLMKRSMLMMILPGFVCAVIGLEALTGSFAILDDTLFSERLGATFQYTNTASIYFSICLIFAMSLINSSKNDFFTALISGLGNIFAFALFMTGSRGGYLAGMAALLLFIFLQPSGLRLRGAIRLSVILVPLVFTIGKFSTAIVQGGYLVPTLWLAISFISASFLSLLLSLVKVIIGKSPLSRIKPVTPKYSGIISFGIFAVIIATAFIFRENIFSIMPEVLSSRLKNLNFNDPNILFRLEFDRDALRLIKDNLLTGFGGGGWETVYQSVQEVNYTANYVHNNFLQVFVESGITGFLAYIAILAVAFINLLISFFRAGEKTARVYIAGFLCGFIALVGHSAFDFDLSYASMILILFTLITVSAVGRTNNDAAYIKEGSGNKRAESYKVTDVLKIVSIITCAALFSTYALFFTAAYNGHKGLVYIDEKKYDSAIAHFEEASRLDQNNSEYLFQLSKLYYNKAKKSNDEYDKLSCLEKARIAGENGANENKYHPVQQKLLLQIYQGLDKPMEAMECAERLVKYQRSNRRNYELLAESYIAAAEFKKDNNDTAGAEELLSMCLELKQNKYCSGGTAYFFNMMGKKSGYTDANSKILTSYFNEAEQLLAKMK